LFPCVVPFPVPLISCLVFPFSRSRDPPPPPPNLDTRRGSPIAPLFCCAPTFFLGSLLLAVCSVFFFPPPPCFPPFFFLSHLDQEESRNFRFFFTFWQVIFSGNVCWSFGFTPRTCGYNGGILLGICLCFPPPPPPSMVSSGPRLCQMSLLFFAYPLGPYARIPASLFF